MWSLEVIYHGATAICDNFTWLSLPVFECPLLVCTLLLCSHFSRSLFMYLELVDLGPLLIQYIFEAVNGAFICCLFFFLFPGLFPVSKIDRVLFFSCIVFKVISPFFFLPPFHFPSLVQCAFLSKSYILTCLS